MARNVGAELPVAGPARKVFADWELNENACVPLALRVVGDADMNEGRLHVMLPIPLPLLDPVKVQVVPEQDPAPVLKLKVNAPVVPLMLATPAPLPPGLTYTPPTQANIPPVVVLCTRLLGTEQEIPAGLPVNRLICGMRCAQTGIAKNSEM